MKTGLVLLFSAALLSTAALADDKPDAQSDAKGSSAIFKTLDADGDGKISKSEAESNQSFANSFDKLDGNSDGFVTKREFQRNTRTRPKTISNY
jgi:Ca2+-binding EF-hand superfamily protein